MKTVAEIYHDAASGHPQGVYLPIGDEGAENLMVVSPAIEEEWTNTATFSSERGKVLFDYLYQNHSILLNEFFVVHSYIFRGKPQKKFQLKSNDYITALTAHPKVKKVFIVGKAAMGQLLFNGKKAVALTPYIGKDIRCSHLSWKPIVVLPDPEILLSSAELEYPRRELMQRRQEFFTQMRKALR